MGYNNMYPFCVRVSFEHIGRNLLLRSEFLSINIYWGTWFKLSVWELQPFPAADQARQLFCLWLQLLFCRVNFCLHLTLRLNLLAASLREPVIAIKPWLLLSQFDSPDPAQCLVHPRCLLNACWLDGIWKTPRPSGATGSCPKRQLCS